MMRFRGGCRVGLALGGGGLRGLSHIGVLAALQQEKVPVSVIAGTSMGAIVGAMYAVEPDVAALKERIHSYLGGDVFRQSGLDFLKPREAEEGGGIFYKFSALIRKSVYYTLSLTRRSLISEETVRKNLACLLPDIELGQTRLPFAATALDLREGREFVFTSGRLRLAVAASSALPGIIPPVELDGMVLVDGGWIDPVPVRPARRLGADMVIGVDVCGEVGESDIPTNGLDTMLRADTVTRYALGGETMRGADHLIRVDLGDVRWSDFARVDDVIRRGRETTLLHIEGIRKSMRRLNLRRLVGLG